MLAKLISSLLLMSGVASAATYQWTGNVSITWTDQANWMPAGSSGGSFPVTLTNGPAATGGTFLTSRLNVNNVTGQELVYSADMGTTIYGGDANGRGLVIGSNSNGNMTITGGTFSSSPSIAEDVIGHLGAKGTLNINGGQFIGSTKGTILGWMRFGKPTDGIGIINVNGGNATFGTIYMANYELNTSATINLNGGNISAQDITKEGRYITGNSTINFNGGILSARTENKNFINVSNANVLAGGASIDTAGYDITIRQSLKTGTSSDGGLTKTGEGELRLSGTNTYNGATKVNGGILTYAYTSAKTGGNTTVSRGATLGLGVSDVHAGYFSTANLNQLINNTLSKVSLDPEAIVGIDTSAGNFTYTPAATTTRGLTKLGANTLTFTGAYNFTNMTSVHEGTLLLTGDCSGGEISVDPKGRISGNATVRNHVTVNGVLMPGSNETNLTQLNLMGGLTMGANSIISIGLGPTESEHGTIQFGVLSANAFAANQTFTFLDLGATAGTRYTSILSGLTEDPGVSNWLVANKDWTGTFFYDQGDVDFQLIAIPEPTISYLLITSFVLAAMRRRHLMKSMAPKIAAAAAQCQ